jgi:nucleoside phosphorylase
MRKKVAIQVAMKEEGLGLIESLGLIENEALDRDFGFRKFHGHFGVNLELIVLLQGTDSDHHVEQIGLEAAAVCASMIIDRIKPDLLMNFGTSGAYAKNGFSVGEVVLVESGIQYHDRRVPIPGYRESQLGFYPVSDHSGLKKHLAVKTAKLSSGSSLEMSERDSEMLQEQNADIKEMECAAIAWVAMKKKTPFVAIKSVTDLLDSPERHEDQFIKNLRLASKNVQQGVISSLQYLDQNLQDSIWKF